MNKKRIYKSIISFCFVVALLVVSAFMGAMVVKADSTQQYLNDADYSITLNVITSTKYRITYYMNITSFNMIKNNAEPGTGNLKFGYQYSVNNGPKETIYIDLYNFDLDLFSTEPQTYDNNYFWTIEKNIINEETLLNSYYLFNAYLYEEATGRHGEGSSYTETTSNLQYITNQYDVGYSIGYRDGKRDGAELSTGNAYQEGYNLGLTDGKEEGRNEGYKEARETFESDATAWIWAFIGGIQGLLNIKFGSVSLGAILLIPFGIEFAWFIIKQFRGGGD